MMASKRMRLGDILLMRGLVGREGLEEALALQRQQGGRLGECIVALGLMTAAALAEVLNETPAMPSTVAQTGVNRAGLLGLMLKFMRAEAYETLPELSAYMALPIPVLQELVDEANAQRLVQVLGSVQTGILSYMRYGLTDAGRAAAADAHAQSQYLGPAPVSLEAFVAQVGKQAIANEVLPEAAVAKGFAGLTIPPNYLRKLLPAVRAGQTILLYGPPGNGKTSIGTRLASLFQNVIYVPYAIEVNNQIIKMYDGRLHRPFTDESAPALPESNSVRAESFDLRWVACRRPIAIAGGELSLDMLDLRYDPVAKFYDAPLHMKALNGMFLIDDFGRQKVSPTELLNRWIVPLESRIDYLTLSSGVTFMIPFDELVVFSTNLEPADLMDPAFLRRIPYKIELFGPDEAAFKDIFQGAARRNGLTLDDATFAYVHGRLVGAGHELAYFQPNFLCAQVAQICTCFNLPKVMTCDLADEALENLYIDLRK
jgi:hypothetical protein